MILLNGNSENISRSEILSRNNHRARLEYSVITLFFIMASSAGFVSLFVWVALFATPLKSVFRNDDVILWKEFYTNHLLVFSLFPLAAFILNLLDVKLVRRYCEQGMGERKHDVTAWKIYNRVASDVQSVIAPAEKGLAYVLGYKKRKLSFEAAVLLVASAGFLVLIPVLSFSLFIGDFYWNARSLMILFSIISCIFALKIFNPFTFRGMALNLIVFVSLLYTSFTSSDSFSHSFSGTLFFFIIWLLVLLSALWIIYELAMFYFREDYRLLVVTDKRLLIYAANFNGTRRALLSNMEDAKTLVARDTHTGVRLMLTDRGGMLFNDIVVPTIREANKLSFVLRDNFAAQGFSHELKRKGFLFSQMFGESSLALLLFIFLSAVVVHLQISILYEGLLTSTQMAIGIADWVKGKPETLYQASKFVIKLLPHNGTAYVFLGLSAYDGVRYDESIRAFKKAKSIAGRMDGQISHAADAMLPKIAEQKKRMKQCEDAYNESFGVTYDAYENYCKAMSIYEVRAGYRNYLFSLLALAKALKKNPEFKEARGLFQTLQTKMNTGRKEDSPAMETQPLHSHPQPLDLNE